MSKSKNIYGDGRASQKIIKILKKIKLWWKKKLPL
jgi:UDP-N-acetylglucosamine 2-epimerase